MSTSLLRAATVVILCAIAASLLLLAATAYNLQRAAAQHGSAIIALSTIGGALAMFTIAAIALLVVLRHWYRSRSVLEATVNGIAQGLAAFQKGRLVAWNERFIELLRIPPELAKIGTPMARFEQADGDGLLRDLAEQAARAETTNETIELERIRPDGAVINLFFSPPRNGVVAFGAIDSTLRHQRDRFLEHAQKMDALGNMTGGIAHDFNNLLTVVLMNLDVMREDRTMMQKFGRRIDLMMAAAQKGSSLVKQLLAYARKQPLEPEVVCLADIVGGLIDLLKRSIGEDIVVTAEIDAQVWPTIVDPAQFESALLNLAFNARDAMPEGGTLAIKLANARIAGAAAARDKIEPGDYVVLTMRDSGCGMSAEVMARAFDPFFTTKSEGRGTGLGLSMVYGFVKQTGGEIKIESEIGKGTTITLFFPKCREPAAAPEPPSASRLPTGTETILIVEDDDRLRATTVGVLKDLGYETLEASDATSAIEVLKARRSVDLLFADLILSGSISGQRLAGVARELHPSIKILYTSGYHERAESSGAQNEVASALLQKPYEVAELAAMVRRVLGQPRLLEPRTA
ncbi:MAG TPA: ATP-binding protein [Stellaceae bacterium]|nr:ATP-binding protein [Stellaceae bacterium]